MKASPEKVAAKDSTEKPSLHDPAPERHDPPIVETFARLVKTYLHAENAYRDSEQMYLCSENYTCILKAQFVRKHILQDVQGAVLALVVWQ